MTIAYAVPYLVVGSVLAAYFGVVRRRPRWAVGAALFFIGCAVFAAATGLPNVLFGI